ncbi:MAG TPA: DUF4230 domain-containing protein [Candidatus Wirthbacteria bacterium]|nr:DUF4230 domain-containing protein [Candidatus Wirthbacteria bacterium]
MYSKKHKTPNPQQGILVKKKLTLALAAIGIALIAITLGGTLLPVFFPNLPALRFERQVNQSGVATLQSIQKVGDLLVLRIRVEKVIDASSGLGWADLLFADRLLLIATGDASFGLDLRGLTADDIQIDNSQPAPQITIKLPKLQVTDVSLDESTTRVYSRTKGWLRFEADPQLESDARLAAIQAIRQQVEDNPDYRQLAEANAHELMRNLLTNLGFGKINFE